MYHHTLRRGRKHFCCLQAFSTREISKRHINECFKINAKQIIKMSKRSEYVRLKNYERKIKSPFLIDADFKTILVREDNGKQNPDESDTNNFVSDCCLTMLFTILLII